jgi:transposase InsO family protein
LLTLTDDFSRKTFGYLLKSKDEVKTKFKEFKLLVENETNKKIKTLRIDNGTEYVNRVFQNWLKENGIKDQTTVPYSPEHNGVAERVKWTVVEKARSMLQDAGPVKKY